MLYRTLGKTGLEVSRIAFGCGPLSGNLTGKNFANQIESIRRAVELGINWFDTARTYGAGQSELSLGNCFSELGLSDEVMVGTKVRILSDDLPDIPTAVYSSIEASLQALQRQRVEVVQIHNAITMVRGSQPTSLSVEDILGEQGVLATLEKLKSEGVIGHIGLTATGDSEAVEQVINSNRIETIQVPFSAANISAGYHLPDYSGWDHYGMVMRHGALSEIGVFAIRVFAGGALLLCPPSPYTYRTKFFPLDLFEQDREIALRLKTIFPEVALAEICIRFVLSHALVDSAIIGFGDADHIEQAVAAMELGDLLSEEINRIEENALLIL
ncbi:MAG: hypothetical protein CMJ76_11695 [Planctomycetaceae bacterium]|nr:hypothetical protein [Planctomycetaceae bacterium]|tara:strand:+ start:2468 stop:3451 length:984 start_codon:yes stop_codon:yes gene_type:complete